MNNKAKGILYIIGAAAGFAFMGFFVRISGDLPTLQKAFFRNAIAAFVAGVILLKNKPKSGALKGNGVSLFLRSAFGFLGIICNFYALDNMNIADASMLNKLSPFFAVLLSIFILKENAKIKDFLIIGVALFGALFVIKPSFSLDSATALVGALGGFCAGAAYTFVRKLGKNGVPSVFIVFFFSAFSSVLLLPFIVLNFKPMTALQTFLLIMAGISASVGQFCITLAYTKAPAKQISVYDYSQVIISAVLSAVFLGELPDGYSFIGYIVIIGAGIIKWKYELKKA